MKIYGGGKIKIIARLRWSLCAGLLGLTVWAALWSSACGSSSATGDDTSTSDGGSTLQVTGTVQVPTITTSSSLSKAIGSKAVSDAAASGLTCTLYTLDGTKVGSATSASDGTFTITATLATLKGSATGTSWTKTVECVCGDSTGAIEVRTYKELTVVEETTTSISVETIDSTTTLAAASAELVHQDSSGTVGCEPSTGQSCTPINSTTDVSCLYAADKTIWTQGSTTGSAGVDDIGWLISAVRAAQAGGVTPSQLEETHWGTILRKLRRNELSSSALSTLTTAAASRLGTSASDLQTLVSNAAALSASIRTVLTEQLASSAGLTTIGSSTPCALGEADTNYMQALVTPLLGTGDASDLSTVYGTDAAWTSMAKALAQATDANYKRFLNRNVGLYTFFKERKTTNTLSAWDNEDSALLYNVMALDFFSASSLAAAAEAEYLEGWANIDAGTCVLSGAWDSIRGLYVDATFQTTSFDPTTHSYSDLTSALTSETFSSTAQTTCEAYADGNVQKACYDAQIGELPLTEDFTSAVANLFPGWTLENGSLTTLSVTNGVALVAVGATTTILPTSSSARWRYSTTRNENGLVIEAKLTSASGLSETGDGVILFVEDADAKAECSLEQATGISVLRAISGGSGGGSAVTISSSVDTSVSSGYLPLILRLTLDSTRATVTCSYASGGGTTLSSGGSLTFTEALSSSYTGGYELQNSTGSLPLQLGVDYIKISEP